MKRALNISNEAHHVMNNHSILLYPLSIFELYSDSEWIKTYENYFKTMIGLPTNEANSELLQFIYTLDGQN